MVRTPRRDHSRGSRLVRLVAALGDNVGDWVADIADDAARQGWAQFAGIVVDVLFAAQDQVKAAQTHRSPRQHTRQHMIAGTTGRRCRGAQ